MIILHSTGCPRCNVLTKKLDSKNIQYKINNDVQAMESKGIVEVPVLEIDGNLLNYKEAVDWINKE